MANHGYLSLTDIGYGEATGFKGVNCRHDWRPYYEGSTRTYTDEELKKMANETVTYNGQKIKKYDAQQMQRKMERQIRQDKKDIVGLKGVLTSNNKDLDIKKVKQDLEQAKITMKLHNTVFNNFLEQTNFRKDYSRLAIGEIENITKLQFSQSGKLQKQKLIMNYQEKNENFKSQIIVPKLYKNKSIEYRIKKYENKIMELYKSNKNENMCILDINTGKLIGNITKGEKRTTVGLDRITGIQLITRKRNSVIAIHNHPENYSFSLTDILSYNKFKQINTMILLTDDYKYYLKSNISKKYNKKELSQLYKDIEKEIKKKYNNLNGIERRDLLNQKFFKKVGWIYEKEKN